MLNNTVRNLPYSHAVPLLTAISSSALSPFQMRAAPNLLRSYLFNGYRRISGEALYFLVPFGLGALRLGRGYP